MGRCYNARVRGLPTRISVPFPKSLVVSTGALHFSPIVFFFKILFSPPPPRANLVYTVAPDTLELYLNAPPIKIAMANHLVILTALGSLYTTGSDSSGEVRGVLMGWVIMCINGTVTYYIRKVTYHLGNASWWRLQKLRDISHEFC